MYNAHMSVSVFNTILTGFLFGWCFFGVFLLYFTITFSWNLFA